MEELLALPHERRLELGLLEQYHFSRDHPAPLWLSGSDDGVAGGACARLVATVEKDTFGAGADLQRAGCVHEFLCEMLDGC